MRGNSMANGNSTYSGPTGSTWDNAVDRLGILRDQPAWRPLDLH